MCVCVLLILFVGVLFKAVVAFTGADREVAKKALEDNQWIEELAVNSVLDSLDQS